LQAIIKTEIHGITDNSAKLKLQKMSSFDNSSIYMYHRALFKQLVATADAVENYLLLRTPTLKTKN
jgi:hypothetical protein